MQQQFLIFLCLIFASKGARMLYENEVIAPDTRVAITNPKITHIKVLWILKDWASFVYNGADIYSPLFSSSTPQREKFLFQIRWQISETSVNRDRDDRYFYSVTSSYNSQNNFAQNLKISFYHSPKSDLAKINMRLKIIFLSKSNVSIGNNTTNYEKGEMKRVSKGTFIEWDNFYSLKELYTLFDKDLPILMKIWYYSEVTESLENFKSDTELDLANQQSFSELGASLIEDKETADTLIFFPGGNRTIHRSVIKSRAPESYDLLFENVVNKKQIINFTSDVSIGVFDQVIHFVYTGRIPIVETDDEWKKVLLGAIHLKVKKFEEICAEKINLRINLTNALNWYKFAKCNNILKIQNYIKELWKINAAVMTPKQWNQAFEVNHNACEN